MTDTHDSIQQSADSMTPSWLERLKEGAGPAWDKLDRIYRRLILWWCLQSGIPASDADDVVQEVFVSARRGLKGYTHQTFRGWLWTVTQRRIMDYWRKNKNQPVAQGGSAVNEMLKEVEAESNRSIGPADQATKILFDQVVAMVKGEFNPTHWRAFWMRVVEEMSAAEVAKKLHVTRDVVHNATSRIRRRIREEFAGVMSE